MLDSHYGNFVGIRKFHPPHAWQQKSTKCCLRNCLPDTVALSTDVDQRLRLYASGQNGIFLRPRAKDLEDQGDQDRQNLRLARHFVVPHAGGRGCVDPA